MFKDTQDTAQAFQFKSTVLTKGKYTYRLKEFDTDSYSLEIFDDAGYDNDSRLYWEEFQTFKEANKEAKKFAK